MQEILSVSWLLQVSVSSVNRSHFEYSKVEKLSVSSLKQ